MQPKTEKSIFETIKRFSVKTFPSSNKPLKLKLYDRYVELRKTSIYLPDVH